MKETKREESQWRREARFHEEAVRRAQEELFLLETRIEDFRNKIQTLTSLGYKPPQFTYDTTQLQQAIDQLPPPASRSPEPSAPTTSSARTQGAKGCCRGGCADESAVGSRRSAVEVQRWCCARALPYRGRRS